MRTPVLLASAALAAAAVARVPHEAVPHVARFARFERHVDVAHPHVEADDVRIRATVTGPSGRVTTVGGFASNGGFAFRFAPRETGLHRYVVRADAGAGEREVASGRFVADPSADHGFVRVDPKRPHHLAFDDGSPLLVLGENRINIYDPSWNYDRADIETYVARMAAAGMTTLRVFVFDDAFAEDAPDHQQLGALEPRVGRFDEKVAERFDRIFEAAERHGVYVVLTLHAIGFSTGDGETWKSWRDNPYSSARGGPAESPRDFFDDPRIRQLETRKLAYAIDRWGYSTHLLAIDLLNEPEWDGEIPETSWVPWAEWMSAQERARDPYAHLVTTGSVGLKWNAGGGDERPWYASPANSTVQWHLYGKEYYEPHALARELTRKVDETWGDGKPVFCGEFAYGGEDHTTYDHTHVGIWTLLMSGAGAVAHSAPPFEIDSDEPMTPERARHFRVLADFLRDARAGEMEPRRDVAVEPRDASAWSLRSDTGDRRAVWILAGERRYGSAVQGARVSLPDLPAGRYRAEWRDDVTGAPLGTTTAASSGHGPTTFAAPAFVRHVAVIVEPE